MATTRIMKRKVASTDPRLNKLTPQARKVLTHLSTTGTLSQREAIMDLSVQSLTRRITELRDAGFNVAGAWKLHPTTGQRYMRYSFNG
jgi:hypothetical protein